MNRDESRTRGPERPPEVFGDVVRCIAPRDTRRGGTWMAVNDNGVAACLLNGYLPGDPTPGPADAPGHTRGEIIPQALSMGGINAVRAYLSEKFDPTPYASFCLVVAAETGVERLHWRGSALMEQTRHEEAWTMFTSSSWNTDEVAAWRARAFAQWCAEGCPMRDGLPAFHTLQPVGEAEWAPLMDRPMSATQSITQVEVDWTSGDIAMRYWPREAIDAGRDATVYAMRLCGDSRSNG